MAGFVETGIWSVALGKGPHSMCGWVGWWGWGGGTGGGGCRYSYSHWMVTKLENWAELSVDNEREAVGHGHEWQCPHFTGNLDSQ